MRFFRIFAIIALILAATVGGALWSVWEAINVKPIVDPPGPGSGDLRPISDSLRIDPILGTVNVLLVGLDDVDGGRRSDAIALAIFDQDSRSVRILSIPRDSRVQIPGHGWDKINHAYVYGGIDLLRETVVNLLNVGINYFVVVNYDSFPRIIDLLGGIDIDVEKTLVYTDYSGKLFINIPKGRQHMNGKTALEYVRFRHDPLGDIGRVQRQQKFLSVVMDKLKSPSVLLKIANLVDEAVMAVNTDLTPMEALRLARFATSLGSERIRLSMAPGKAAYIGDLSYWIIDLVEVPKMLVADVDNAFVPEVESEDVAPTLDMDSVQTMVAQVGKIAILNGDGASGLGRRASQIFQKLGIDVAYTGNAKHFDYRSSNVIYPENATEKDKQAANALAKLCGITNKALIQRNRTASMVSVILGHDKEAVFKRLENAIY